MYSLGQCLDHGESCDADVVMALPSYCKAAEGGSAEGMLRLATCLEYGAGCDVDYDAAMAWYRRAAEARRDK